MFSPDVEAIIPAWKEKKDAQWAAIKDAMPGLQLMTAGDRGTHYTLVCSALDDSFYEAVVFGQLPQVVLEEYGSRLNRRYRDVPEDKKPLDKRAIDLSDDQIAQIIAAWRAGASAMSLPFVMAVGTVDGKTIRK